MSEITCSDETTKNAIHTREVKGMLLVNSLMEKNVHMLFLIPNDNLQTTMGGSAN